MDEPETHNPTDAQRLDPRDLLAALSRGYFPMAEDAGALEVGWYRPDPRAVMPLDEGEFRVRRSLAKFIRRGALEVRFDVDFAAVMDACAAPRVACPGSTQETGTWINATIRDAYAQLADHGLGHSVEVFADGRRVGGLYGVALGGAFLAESMFSHRPYASQVCLVALVKRLRARGFSLMDVQFVNPHLEQFGVEAISAEAYESRLWRALGQGPCW
ncbi:MAG: leucyl/phenylalanyl-tRNA--protein transferase [Planctomycetota bacterium]